MAFDKIVDSAALDADLTSVADAIREKGGISDALTFPEGFVSAVEAISAGGGDNGEAIVAGIMDRTLEELYNETVTTITCSRLFQDNKALKNVILPNVTSIGNYVFTNCASLESVHFPLLEGMGMNVFEGCTSLTELVFPLCVHISNNANFKGCTGLTKIDFARKYKSPTASVYSNFRFSQTNFNGCSNLSAVILRAEDKIWDLGNLNNFDGTPFASGGTGGTVYVPSALIESYQTATNWSTLYAAGTCNFVAIEGSEYE